jgi:hypothetical protein
MDEICEDKQKFGENLQKWWEASWKMGEVYGKISALVFRT